MGLRAHVNFLMAHGHPEARHYPLPVLWTETTLLRRRLNSEIATEAVLTQLAVTSVLSKDGAKEFRKRIKELTED